MEKEEEEEEESSKSSTTQNDIVDVHFFDAVDDFPFYDCFNFDEDVSLVPNSKPNHETPPPPSNLRRRRHLSLISGHDLNDSSNPTSSVSSENSLSFRGRKFGFFKNIKENEREFGNTSKVPNPNSVLNWDTIPVDDSIASYIDANSRERKFRFSRNLKENGKERETLDSLKLEFISERENNVSNEEKRENSTITSENNAGIEESITDDSRPPEINVNSSSFPLFLANLVVRAIGFQFNLLISFFTFPIWLLYCSYMFVTDPFLVIKRGKEYLCGKLLGMWGLVFGSVSPYVYEWLKDQKSMWKLALKLGWGMLWSVYACVVLVCLLVWAIVVCGFLMKFLVEEPIWMKEYLNFDYTKTSPVAFVPMSDCSGLNCGLDCVEKSEIGSLRVIPPYHKLQVSVALTLPESDYNRNLGIFQVRVDFLSADGRTLASSRHPCMLQFKSLPIRLLLTFLKMAPLVTGYLSESQTMSVKIKLRGREPTACLRVIIEQRAEFSPGAGIPEIYAASLTAETELPLLKRILWNWKKTLFIWISIMMFTMELFIVLLCCRPVILPRIRWRQGSPDSSAPVRR